MVGTNFKPSFEMFRNLTKEDVLNAPSVPVERLREECKPLYKAMELRKRNSQKADEK